mmetsp:Transcript_39609/g.112075  ORF Transcript_39609/g.112075 Transcript_39609/m.112075 type:complete len:248 (-) Transcript_39609:585-1328(-)
MLEGKALACSRSHDLDQASGQAGVCADDFCAVLPECRNAHDACFAAKLRFQALREERDVLNDTGARGHQPASLKTLCRAALPGRNLVCHADAQEDAQAQVHQIDPVGEPVHDVDGPPAHAGVHLEHARPVRTGVAHVDVQDPGCEAKRLHSRAAVVHRGFLDAGRLAARTTSSGALKEDRVFLLAGIHDGGEQNLAVLHDDLHAELRPVDVLLQDELRLIGLEPRLGLQRQKLHGRISRRKHFDNPV